MINVSFNDLMIGSSDLPPPRTASRSDGESAFATLMDEAGNRQDAPAKEIAREHAPEPRERQAQPATSTNSGETDRPVAQTGTENKVEAPATEDAPKMAQNAGAARPDQDQDQDRDQAHQQTGELPPDSVTTTTAAPQSVATTAAVPQPMILDPAMMALFSAPQTAPGQIDNTVSSAAPVTPARAPAPKEGPIAPAGAHPEGLAAPTSASETIPAAPRQAAIAAPTATPTVGADVASTPAPAAVSTETPNASPVPAGKFTPDSLFTVTLLAQSAPPSDAATTLPPVSNPAATAPVAKSSAVPPPTTETLDRPIASQHADLPSAFTPGKAPAAKGIATAAAHSQAVPVQTMSDLLSTAGIEVDFSQADAPAPVRLGPALANGMIAQLSALQQTEGQTTTVSGTSATSAIGDALAASGNTLPQMATAIAAPPTAQAVADEPRPKFAANADNLVLNAPAPASGTQSTHVASLEQLASAKPSVPTPPVSDQVAVHIAKAAAEGSDKINIKLKPASLGQIEVQLDVAPDGRVHAVIAADKPETLDLLQRDARALERALGDAGLRTDSGSLSFNLRGQGQQYGGGADHGGAGGYGRAPERAGADLALLAESARIGAYLNSRAAAGGVDIRV